MANNGFEPSVEPSWAASFRGATASGRRLNGSLAIMSRPIVIGRATALVWAQAHAKSPECDRPNNWAASMAFGYLKNARFTNNDKVDFAKTHVERLASEKVGKDLYRQVHLVTYVEKSGREFEVITINDASSEECSVSGVEAYLVAQKLGRK